MFSFALLRYSRRLLSAAAATLVLAAACSEDSTGPAPGFLGGTSTNREIGVVVGGKTLTLFQLGSPTTQVHIPLGTSSTITPVGFSLGGRRAAVPLGNAASVALIDLVGDTIERFYQFPSGNTTGSAFVDDTTIVAANTTTSVLGRMTVKQANSAITQTVAVCPSPTAVTAGNGRIFVICGNLDQNFNPLGPGIVTIVDAKTFTVTATVNMGGTNPNDGAVGPDGLLYVVNTGAFGAVGNLSILDPATQQVTTIENMGVNPGAVSIDKNGLAYISSFTPGTLVWNTKTRQFVRGTDNYVHAPNVGTKSRGAFAATTSSDGSLYQVFFGSTRDGLLPYTFVYAPSTFALRDSIAAGSGPAAIQIRTF